MNPNPPVYSFTEADWNTFSITEVEKKGKDCDAFHAYRASKTVRPFHPELSFSD